MNSANIRKMQKKKHAGRPSSISNDAPTASPIALIRNFAIGSGCSLGVALLFLFGATMIVHQLSDPCAAAFPAANAALYLTAFFSGIIAARLYDGPLWLRGLIAGAALLLICLPIGIFLPADTSEVSANPLLLRLLMLPFSLLGAIAGQKRVRRHSRRRH